MNSATRTNLTNPDIWIRLLYMLVFALLLVLARLVIGAVAVLQFLLVLITASDNSNLRNLGQGTAKWCLQTYLFLTFNSESKPFPFSDWPEVDEAVGEVAFGNVDTETETTRPGNVPKETDSPDEAEKPVDKA